MALPQRYGWAYWQHQSKAKARLDNLKSLLVFALLIACLLWSGYGEPVL